MSEPQPFGRRLRRFASFNVAQQVWLAVLSILATPILYHGLGAAAYGLLALVNLVAAQLSILEFGFGHATIRRLALFGASKNTDEMSRTLATSLRVFVGTAVVGAIIILAATDVLVERFFQIPPDLVATGKVALRIGALFFAFSVLGNLAGSVWQGLQRFGYLNLMSGAAATAQLLGSVALVKLGFGVLDVLVWSVLLGAATLLMNAWWLMREVPGVRAWGPADGKVFREMAGFGLLLMVAGLLTQVFFSGGALVLGHYVAVGALPFFTVPFGLYQRLNRMGYGLGSALYPLISEMEGLSDAPSLRRVFTSGTRILLLVGITAMAPAVLVASPFLALWLGADFASRGGVVLELLFASFALSLATTPSVELARGAGRAGLLAAYAGLLAAANVGGVALLAPSMGAAGAGVAMLSAQVLGSTFLMVRVGGRACLQLFSGRIMVLIGGAVGGALWGLTAVTSPWARVAVAAAVGVGLAIASVAWGLTDDERVTLRRMVPWS